MSGVPGVKPDFFREFFAYFPVKTTSGWAWLCDIREYWVAEPEAWPELKLYRVRERLYYGGS